MSETGGPADPDVTIVVVPRERFAMARRSLETLYRETEPTFRLVYVDGGSPPALSVHLAAEARRRGFEIIRTESYLSPNGARNLGLPHATGRYVVFLDNDVLVAPGWLSALMRCAEETGADLVGPLYGIGEPENGQVHMAGGTARIEEAQGVRRLLEKHRFAGRFVSEIEKELRRDTTELLEFHCLLARLDTLREITPLDEELLNMGEHVDLCLAVRERGGSVWFEPASRVSYVPPSSLDSSDRAFFRLRWSERWTQRSLDRLREKWRLAPDDPFLQESFRWVRSHRRLPLKRVQRLLERIPGRALAHLALYALAAAELVWNRCRVGIGSFPARRPLGVGHPP